MPDENITVFAEETPAITHALETANEGDLLVITADDLTAAWKQIINWNSDVKPKKETIPGTKVFVPERAKRYELEEDEVLVTDDRGVRISINEDSLDD